jgi:hypothetical protein
VIWDLHQKVIWDLHQKVWKAWMKCILTWTMLLHTAQLTVICPHHLKVICQWTEIWHLLHLMIIQEMM